MRKTYKKYLRLVRRQYRAFRKKRRIAKVAKSCGCVCFCPHCKDVLNDQALVDEHGESVRYHCQTCKDSSLWLFGVYPFPVCVTQPVAINS